MGAGVMAEAGGEGMTEGLRLVPRTRPTMDDYRKARAFDWLAEHPHDVMHIGEVWCGYADRSQLLPSIEDADPQVVIDFMRPLIEKMR
jgi:hypothetical protein